MPARKACRSLHPGTVLQIAGTVEAVNSAVSHDDPARAVSGQRFTRSVSENTGAISPLVPAGRRSAFARQRMIACQILTIAQAVPHIGHTNGRRVGWA